MCKEVWLKVYGTKLSAQILMSEDYSEMQNLVPVAYSRKTAKPKSPASDSSKPQKTQVKITLIQKGFVVHNLF